MSLRVLLYGENWPGTHVDCISKILEKKKIAFKIFDFYKILSPVIFDNIVDKVLRKINYNKNEKLINEQLQLEIELFRPSLLLISKGINIFPETLYKFKKNSITIANWNPDDFFNHYNSSQSLLDSLKLYDIVFSARKHLFEEYRNKGISNPLYLEWYYIPWLHKKPDVIPKIENKITFIGTFSKRREQILSSINSDIPIEIWGGGWGFSKIYKNKNILLQKRVLNQEEFPNIISASRINLNILTNENRDLTNLKIFEITASFGLLLTENTAPTFDILKDNCLYYDQNNINHLNATISNVFNSKVETVFSEIRNNGYNRIHENMNSIDDRVMELLQYAT